jgi:hypothetical protein
MVNCRVGCAHQENGEEDLYLPLELVRNMQVMNKSWAAVNLLKGC